MGTTLGSKYIPYTYMDPLGKRLRSRVKGLGCRVWASSRQCGFPLKVTWKNSLTATQYRVATAAPTRYSGEA